VKAARRDAAPLHSPQAGLASMVSLGLGGDGDGEEAAAPASNPYRMGLEELPVRPGTAAAAAAQSAVEVLLEGDASDPKSAVTEQLHPGRGYVAISFGEVTLCSASEQTQSLVVFEGDGELQFNAIVVYGPPHQTAAGSQAAAAILE